MPARHDACDKRLLRGALRVASRAAELDSILASHWIDPHGLRADDFDGYFANRETDLLGLISDAMGQLAYREQQEAPSYEPAQDEPSSDETEDQVEELAQT